MHLTALELVRLYDPTQAMAAMENSRMKLSYFDARGVAETTRYMLAVTKTPYEDFRYGFTFGTPGDFSTVQRPEFDAAKAAGKLDANLGRLPLLEVDGQVFGQSKTIERFVAKRVGMMGATPIEEAQIDCICEHLRDCKDKYMLVSQRRDKSFHSYRIYRLRLLTVFSSQEGQDQPRNEGRVLRHGDAGVHG